MSRRRKIILTVLALLIGITVLRETGVVSLNYCRSSISSNTTGNSTNNSGMIDDSCADVAGTEIPVVVEYEGSTYREAPATDPELWIRLSNTNSGPGWMPLYKNIDFSANAFYTFVPTLKDKNSGRCKIVNLSGYISVTGSIEVTGFCSWREVKQLIAKNLITIVREKGHETLKNL